MQSACGPGHDAAGSGQPQPAAPTGARLVWLSMVCFLLPPACGVAATVLVRARAARFLAGVVGFVAGLVLAAVVAGLARRRRKC